MTGTTVSVDATVAAVVREAAGGSPAHSPGPGELGRGRGVGPGCPADRVGALAPGGIPQRPGAWLATVARHRAVDRLRRDARYRDKLAQFQGWRPSPQADDRLRLMFSCCHPALSRQAQLALTLRAVCGFTTAQIAHALVASEAAIAQRLGRARRKIVTAAIPYRIPGDDDLDERLAQVLAVLCLLCNEGIWPAAAAGRRAATWPRTPPGWRPNWPPCTRGNQRRWACWRSWAAPGPRRRPLRRRGELVLLSHQDRSRWDRAVITEAVATLERAARLGRPGPTSCRRRSSPATPRPRPGRRPTGPRSWPCTICSWP